MTPRHPLENGGASRSSKMGDPGFFRSHRPALGCIYPSGRHSTSGRQRLEARLHALVEGDDAIAVEIRPAAGARAAEEL